MKFSCERCDAQYMISDEKVGPNGVKVRCKKCSNVILVRRAVENGALAPEAAAKPAVAAAAGGAPGAGLDDELGSAFDNAFGDRPAPAAAAAPSRDLDATQGLGPEDAARIAAAAPAPAPTEWYVAIGQAQVGPLPLAEVKRKWEGGDVGPDSLVWRPGMGDWSPLSSVPDLAAYLAPVPQPGRAAAAPAGIAVAAAAHAPAAAREPTPTPATPGPEVSWKPAGANALAALASEEIAARGAEPKAEPKRPVPSGVRSLVEDLPDGGGVDPTGAIPLPMKALEQTEERKIERRSSVARGAEELRRKRGNARVVVALVAVVAVLGGGAAALVLGGGAGRFTSLGGQGATTPVATPAQPAPAATPAPAPAAVAAAPAAQPAAATTPAAPAPAQVASAEPATAKAEPPPAAKPEPAPVAKAEPPARAAPERVAAAPRPAREAPRRDAPPRAPVARAEPAAEPPPPAPARKPARDPLLDFDGGGKDDDALAAALGQTPSGRSVYVPGGTAKPAAATTVTDSQVTGAILTKRDALAACVASQRKADPEASGTIRMGWSIAPDGSPQNVRCLTPEFASTEFARCVSGVLRGVRFPSSTSGRADVTFPLKF